MHMDSGASSVALGRLRVVRLRLLVDGPVTLDIFTFGMGLDGSAAANEDGWNLVVALEHRTLFIGQPQNFFN